MRGEDAVIEQQVNRRARRDRGEFLQQFDGLEGEMRGAIAPDRVQLDEDASAGRGPGEREADEVAAEPFEAGASSWGTQASAWR
jgi:hypothetical protein